MTLFKFAHMWRDPTPEEVHEHQFRRARVMLLDAIHDLEDAQARVHMARKRVARLQKQADTAQHEPAKPATLITMSKRTYP